VEEGNEHGIEKEGDVEVPSWWEMFADRGPLKHQLISKKIDGKRASHVVFHYFEILAG
jgi:hypothetical protein